LRKGDFDISVAGTTDSIMMVEGEAKEISEAEFLEAIRFAHTNVIELCNFQKEFAKEVGKPKRALAIAEDDSQIISDVKAVCLEDIKSVFRNCDEQRRQEAEEQ
jgi:polyribonucleotide nucleotidyltransferase